MEEHFTKKQILIIIAVAMGLTVIVNLVVVNMWKNNLIRRAGSQVTMLPGTVNKTFTASTTTAAARATKNVPFLIGTISGVSSSIQVKVPVRKNLEDKVSDEIRTINTKLATRFLEWKLKKTEEVSRILNLWGNNSSPSRDAFPPVYDSQRSISKTDLAAGDMVWIFAPDDVIASKNFTADMIIRVK